MFKSREDIYTTKTFASTEEAATFVSVIGQSFKQQGYTITEMSIREAHMYSKEMDNDDDHMYVGTVAAYKETENKKEEEPASQEPAPETVN